MSYDKEIIKRLAVMTKSSFRWLELIAIIVVVVVLGALIAPAVLAAREAARRQQCGNHLKSLSIGVQNYADTFLLFPLGTVGSRELSPPKRFSWYLTIWPFFEGKPPVLQVDTNQAWDAEVNRNPQLRREYSWDPDVRLKSFPLRDIRMFSCPNASPRQNAQGIQVTQYVGMAGLGSAAVELASDEAGIGIWGYDRQLRSDAIADGAAQTILFTETVRELGPWYAGGPPTVRGLDPSKSPLLGLRGQFGGLHRTTTTAMADASIRTLDPNIDPAVFSALTTINGRD